MELQAFIAVFVNRFRFEISDPNYKLWMDGCNIVVVSIQGQFLLP